jgi:hypothetical protein
LQSICAPISSHCIAQTPVHNVSRVQIYYCKQIHKTFFPDFDGFPLNVVYAIFDY